MNTKKMDTTQFFSGVFPELGIAAGVVAAAILWLAGSRPSVGESLRWCFTPALSIGHGLAVTCLVWLLGDWVTMRKFRKEILAPEAGRAGLAAVEFATVAFERRSRWWKYYIAIVMMPLLGMLISIGQLKVLTSELPMVESFSPLIVTVVEAAVVLVLAASLARLTDKVLIRCLPAVPASPVSASRDLARASGAGDHPALPVGAPLLEPAFTTRAVDSAPVYVPDEDEGLDAPEFLDSSAAGDDALEATLDEEPDGADSGGEVLEAILDEEPGKKQ